MKKSALHYCVLCLVVLCVSLFSSCETEVDLNAPYKSTTVIFGLLDADANSDGLNNQLDTQWIKINRTFLGDGNNLTYAQVRDSSEYDDDDFISKKVERYFDGNLVEEWDLTALTVSNKSVNGIFYGPEQTLYYFIPAATGLDQESTYKLVIDFAAKEDVSAETDIINGNEIQFLQPQIQTTISLASGSAASILYTQNARIKWNGASNARSYDAVIRFHFTEFKYDNPEQTGVADITEKFIDFSVGSYKVTGDDETDQFEIEFNGESFFAFLENSLEKSPNIKRQIGTFDGFDTRCFDVILGFGNDQLNTYIEVNSPVSGIVQERPNYSNINNGLGLFAARSSRSVKNLRLYGNSQGGNPQTGNLHAFCAPLSNSRTIGLNFCDPNPTSDYACE